MQQLKNTYFYGGLCQKLLKRSLTIAIYTVHLSKDSPIISYEVFKIKVKTCTIFDFGHSAWSYDTPEKALNKYENLIKIKN